MDDAPKLVARLANGPAAVQQSRIAVIRALQPHAICLRTQNHVEVVLEELVGNLVIHGQGVQAITVAMAYRDGVVDLIVEDDGAAFDPFQAPEPEPFTKLADAPVGGLGIPLVRRLTTAAGYARVGSGSDARNRVSVRIKNG